MYRLQKSQKSKRRRLLFWLLVLLLLIGLIVAVQVVRAMLRPKVIIKQATAVTSSVTYKDQTKHYDEPDFGIDLPLSWKAIPRPAGPYQSYTWQSSDVVTDGQQIEIFEDTIPVNFAVNRALIVDGEIDHLTIDGVASDNCSEFTKGMVAARGQTGVPAKWQGIDFLCDQFNTERDTIGTSSTDGVNVVILKNQSTGSNHKFFFTYTNHATNPDYTVFYNAITSLHMQ